MLACGVHNWPCFFSATTPETPPKKEPLALLWWMVRGSPFVSQFVTLASSLMVVYLRTVLYVQQKRPKIRDGWAHKYPPTHGERAPPFPPSSFFPLTWSVNCSLHGFRNEWVFTPFGFAQDAWDTPYASPTQKRKKERRMGFVSVGPPTGGRRMCVVACCIPKINTACSYYSFFSSFSSQNVG